MWILSPPLLDLFPRRAYTLSREECCPWTPAWTICGRTGPSRENFGKNPCCPPEAPDYARTRAVLDSFSTGILFRVHHWNATAMAAEGARRLFLDGYYKALAFGSGPCKLCPSCAPEGCRFPGKAVPAMEACGIDVFATARAHGLEVRTLRVLGEERNHFGLILVE